MISWVLLELANLAQGKDLSWTEGVWRGACLEFDFLKGFGRS